MRKSSGATVPLPLGQADKYQLYGKESLLLSVHDVVRFTKAATLPSGKRVSNGLTREVEGFAKNGDLMLAGGLVVPKEFGHLSRGWISTSISAQGRTEDWTLVAEDSASGRAASKEQLYVSASRAREGLTLYTDDKKAVLDAAERVRVRMTATEFAGSIAKAVPERRNRVKEHAERLIRMGMVARAYATQKLDDIRMEIGRMTERLTGRGQEKPEVAYGR
ncbi:hypothetical protein [Singulisphaera sp. PoT]|uniref:hypothetical protein n=1 Tax=Singulisphaera sp. PoT TaxID=3411797 RepID=UPI003BF5EC36